jgi:hypothetical protein
MSYALYEVLPVGDEWLVRLAADSQSELLPTKPAAVRRARELGKQYSDWRVRVLSPTGKIEAEYSSEQVPAG